MDAHTKNQRNRHARLPLRFAALALALAALPAIGAGYDARPDAAATVTGASPDHAAQLPPHLSEPAAAPVAPAVTDTLPAPEFDQVPAPIATMEPGDFLWNPEVAPSGPVVVVVSLPEQRAHVYRNGLRIGVSTISSGKPGHETPTGVFPILQKRVEHYSNLYDNAPMPYMQRLTWDGVALHAGRIPGHPASHGCIRLPREFAELLFDVTKHGTTVVVADETSHGPDVVSPGQRAPVDAYTGLEPSKVDVASLAQVGSTY